MRGEKYNHNHCNETLGTAAVSTETPSVADLATA